MPDDTSTSRILRSALTGSLALAGSTFAMQALAGGYAQDAAASPQAAPAVAKKAQEGKCGEGKCGVGPER